MFISRHTLKWTKTCRSSGDFPHAHTAHFLLNRHIPGWGATHGRFHGRAVFAISIHAPRMGSDQETIPIGLETQFQSTLPGWGATPIVARDVAHVQFQSTLPGWGATRHIATAERNIMLFQSTLPGWGATPSSQTTAVVFHVFQSTLPGWGATHLSEDYYPIYDISIHAPRMGSDFGTPSQRTVDCRFQSTLPGWGATPDCWPTWAYPRYFNPRSPDGERRARKL